jgi:phosphoenolpyruvate carboxykinase (GTP)
MGDYMRNWLTMGDRLRKVGRMPRIFHVNWFQKGPDGRFLWPGFGENSRVVEWIVNRLEGEVAAVASPIGLLPQTLTTEGLTLAPGALDTLLSVDHDLVAADLDDAEQFLSQFGERLPGEILDELHSTRDRLFP